MPALEEYRRKRNFRRTPEPRGDRAVAKTKRTRAREKPLPFVIQKHAATRLHYDFRLELDGVLKSWAVPKGPSLVPGDRRLAVEVEDHPVEYGGFEGTIPKGEYGGGSVLLWDRGTWIPTKDPREGLRSGHLEFDLEGEKLRGRWILIRMKSDRGERPPWLLMKERDRFARNGRAKSIVEERPESVTTGRTIDEIGRGEKPEREWSSSRPKTRGSRLEERRKRLGLPEPTAKTAREARRERPRVPPKPTRKGPPKRDPGRKAPLREPPTGDPPKPPVREPPDEAREASAFLGVRVTHPDRVLDPVSGATKEALAAYIASVAERMFPHVAGRPIMILRCPEGRHRECFFQKHPGTALPKGVTTVTVTERAGKRPYLSVEDPSGLVGLVQVGAIEVHVWGSRADREEQPDRVVFDLDPDPTVPWAETVKTAHRIRDRLEEVGLESYAKTTGGKGIHVVVPIRRGPEWAQAVAFSSGVASEIVRRDPERFTAHLSKARRRGKILIDTLRNRRGATWVAPYSPRAREGIPVSTPVSWEELTARLVPARLTFETVPARMGRTDPWAEMGRASQTLTASILRKVASGRM